MDYGVLISYKFKLIISLNPKSVFAKKQSHKYLYFKSIRILIYLDAIE